MEKNGEYEHIKEIGEIGDENEKFRKKMKYEWKEIISVWQRNKYRIMKQ